VILLLDLVGASRRLLHPERCPIGLVAHLLLVLAVLVLVLSAVMSVLGTQAAAVGDDAAAQLLLRMGDYEGAARAYAELLTRKDYEDNDPERMRWLEQYAKALHLKKDDQGARWALTAALAILTAQGGRAHPSAVNLLGQLAVVERQLGNARQAGQYCAELAALKARAPALRADVVVSIQKACEGLTLPVQPILGGGSGNWDRATQIAKQLGIEGSAQSKSLISSAAIWVNLYLGHYAPLKVAPAWEKPLERSEADTIAIFLAAKHNVKGSGAFVPSGIERAIVVEEVFLSDPQPVPPNAIGGLQIPLERVHLLVPILLHEVGHAQARDQANYATANCAQRRAMETQADLFAARTLRSALVGERGVAAQTSVRRTMLTMVVLGWNYTSNRSLRELFPDSLKDDPAAHGRAYCEGGQSHPAMELRLLEMYKTILGSEYAAMFGEDTISSLVADFKGKATKLPNCGCP
jgi:hypothetical protein